MKARPKLQLQPRTKPVEPIVVQEEPAAEPAEDKDSDAQESAPAPAPAAPVPAVNIFGAAKPVDTAAKEREIEERLARSNAEAKPKEEGYNYSLFYLLLTIHRSATLIQFICSRDDKRPAKEGAWGRRNGVS